MNRFNNNLAHYNLEILTLYLSMSGASGLSVSGSASGNGGSLTGAGSILVCLV